MWHDYGLNKLSSGALWIQFLHYYTERFDYEKNIVTIRQYEPLLRTDKGWFRRTIAIEDPFLLTHNLSEKLSLRSKYKVLISYSNSFLLLFRLGTYSSCIYSCSQSIQRTTEQHRSASTKYGSIAGEIRSLLIL